MNYRLPLVLVVCCAVIAGILKLFCDAHPAYDFKALMAANGIMLVLSLAAWALFRKNANERPQAFVRGVYGATMLRLFVCIIGILSYAMINKATLYKPTLFVMFGIYMVYTIIETLFFSQVAKRV